MLREAWMALSVVVLLSACSSNEEASSGKEIDEWPAWMAETQIDTVGVRNLSEGDTLLTQKGITFVETTVKFPPQAEGGEAVAWEFFARELNPVKLIIVRYDRPKEHFELVGESQTVIPRRRGVNRFVLREPIPVGFKYMFGVVQPESPAIPFRKIHNWKTLLTIHPLERPLMRRDLFATYGWRFAVRVFWRPGEK